MGVHGLVNGDLQEGLHQRGLCKTASSPPIPVVSPCWPTPPQETLQHVQVVLVQPPVGFLLLSSESWCIQGFVCALQDWGPCFSQWKSCSQILLAFKVRFPGDSQTLYQVPRLRSLVWGSEPSQQWENFFGIIVLQFVSHPPGGYGIWLLWFCPSYCLTVASSLSLDVGYLFLVGSRVLLLVVVQQLVVILVLSQEEVCVCPSTLPSWTRLILLIFESLILKLQLNIIIYLLKK